VDEVSELFTTADFKNVTNGESRAGAGRPLVPLSYGAMFAAPGGLEPPTDAEPTIARTLAIGV
jgi:hypothetical protein